MTNFITGETMTIAIEPFPMLLFTSLMCSSDVVAAVSIVDYDA
jgi:hypothetical protein